METKYTIVHCGAMTTHYNTEMKKKRASVTVRDNQRESVRKPEAVSNMTGQQDSSKRSRHDDDDDVLDISQSAASIPQ